jgi:hypothetical protein
MHPAWQKGQVAHPHQLSGGVEARAFLKLGIMFRPVGGEGDAEGETEWTTTKEQIEMCGSSP